MKSKCGAASDTPHFFKIILDDTDILKLRIPRKFERKHGSEISSSVSLKVRNGAPWKVELTKCADGTWLHNGWAEFAKHYSLSYGSFLVFRYEGNGHFHVIIFDKSATEISYTCSGTHGSSVPNGERFQDHAMEDNDDDVSIEILDNIPPFKKTRTRSPSPSSQPREKIDTKSNPSTCVKGSTIQSNVVKSEIPEADSNAKRRDKRPPKLEICSRKGTLLNEIPDSGAFQDHAVEDDDDDVSIEILDHIPPSKKTKVTSPSASSRPGKKISSTLNNDLPFAILADNPPSMRTRLRLSSSSRVGHSPIKSSVVNANINGKRPQQTEDCRKKETLSVEGRGSAAQRFNSFKSEHPYFPITISPSGINQQLSPPYLFVMEHMKKDTAQLTLENGGKMWPVTVCRYPNSRSAKLTGGWRDFVRENSMKVGEMCVFELINKEDAVLKVIFFRD